MRLPNNINSTESVQDPDDRRSDWSKDPIADPDQLKTNEHIAYSNHSATHLCHLTMFHRSNPPLGRHYCRIVDG